MFPSPTHAGRVFKVTSLNLRPYFQVCHQCAVNPQGGRAATKPIEKTRLATEIKLNCIIEMLVLRELSGPVKLDLL
jgi:hypothetical protein